MDLAAHNKIVSLIWGIADHVHRDLFKRGKYPDVVLPRRVLRRLDTPPGPRTKALLDAKKILNDAGLTNQRNAPCQASGNTSQLTLRGPRYRGNQQILAGFAARLDGFPFEFQDTLNKFKFTSSSSATDSRRCLSPIL